MRIASLVCAASIVLATREAAAESSYCEKVHARAAADASLLFAPIVSVQGIRFPSSGVIDTATLQGNGYQLRASFEVSPLDFYKGFRVLDVGRADCAQHEATEKAAQLVALGADLGKLAALRKQAAYLDERRSQWEAVAAKTQERLDAHVITVAEALDVRARVAELERKRIQVGGEIDRVAARGDVQPVRISSLVAAITSASRRFESEASSVRTPDAWDLRISGGVVPQSNPDFFGMITLSFNFGGVGRYVYEASYLRARAAEVRGARYELPDQLERLRATVRASLQQAHKERAIIERELSTLEAARAALAAADTPAASHALSIIDLDSIGLVADKTELDTLVEQLAQMEEDHER